MSGPEGGNVVVQRYRYLGRYEGAMMRSGSTRRFDLSSVYYSI